MQDCTFCIRDKPDHPNRSRIVYQTDNFYVTPTFGQITDGGYLLIIPTDHYSCIGALSKSLMDEFKEVKHWVNEALDDHYQAPIYFEHGILGQTISHAHMHAVPVPDHIDLYDEYNKVLPDPQRLEDIGELESIFRTRGSYLYYEINDYKFAFVPKVVPQYGRIVVADALGVPERANWRTMDKELDKILIAQTMEKLKQSK